MPSTPRQGMKMLNQEARRAANRGFPGLFALGLVLVSLFSPTLAVAAPGTATVTVVSPNALGAPISVGYRWILEEDTTYHAAPGTPAGRYAGDELLPELQPGRGLGPFRIGHDQHHDSRHQQALPDFGPARPVGRRRRAGLPDRRLLHDERQADPAGADDGPVVVSPQPVPTAQMFIRAFEDTNPLNNTWDDTEAGLGNFPVFIYDMAGQMSTDTYGNPLGTVYNGLNPDGTPHVAHLGDGSIHTMTEAEVGDPGKNPYGLEVGEALVKNHRAGQVRRSHRAALWPGLAADLDDRRHARPGHLAEGRRAALLRGVRACRASRRVRVREGREPSDGGRPLPGPQRQSQDQRHDLQPAHDPPERRDHRRRVAARLLERPPAARLLGRPQRQHGHHRLRGPLRRRTANSKSRGSRRAATTSWSSTSTSISSSTCARSTSRPRTS